MPLSSPIPLTLNHSFKLTLNTLLTLYKSKSKPALVVSVFLRNSMAQSIGIAKEMPSVSFIVFIPIASPS